MNLSFEWLNDYLDLSSVAGLELAEKMSRTGIEIESVHNYADHLSGLKVGYVKECQDHPDSDHLKLTQVDVGLDQDLQIICGAPNVGQGQKVMVAVPGAKLPGGLEIKETVLRGVKSQGMICSLQEIGFADNVVPKKYANGILVLPEDSPVGQDIVDYLKLDDPILEMDLTPNRADALSVLGTAYEVAISLDQAVELGENDFQGQATGLLEGFSLDVDDSKLSKYFSLGLVKDVTVKESPLWLQVRLMKMGIRPLNNVVDVTNYMMLLYGQPLHAYDFDKLPSKNIGLRLANDQEVLKTLDGNERSLSAEDMVITSGNQAIGLAGVMGGFDTEVTEETETVLLESASFNPVRIRKTANRHNLRSEASQRNEKGLNQDTILQANQVACQMIGQLGQGICESAYLVVDSLDQELMSVTLPYASIKQKLGIDLDLAALKDIFKKLAFQVDYQEDQFTVQVPNRRWDIKIEADVLEEIARVYGYDKIPATMPVTSGQVGSLSPKQKFVRRTQELLEGMGLNQVISYILTSESKAELLKSESYPIVKLALPMSEDRTCLRQSMFPALLEVAQFNQARQAKQIAIYETGRVFFGQGPKRQPLEEERVAIMVSGIEDSNTWYQDEGNFDFYSLKGMVETYFQGLRLSDQITYHPVTDLAVMHPGRTAAIHYQGQAIGYLGQVHPTLCDQYDLNRDTYFMEINIDVLLDADLPNLVQKAIPKFPSSSRDIAMLVNQDQSHGQIVDLIRDHGGQYLQSVDLFDLYQGDKIEAGKKSLAYHLIFQNPSATLKDEDIQQAMDDIVEVLQKELAIEIR